MINEKVFTIVSNILDFPLEKITETTSAIDIESWDSLAQMKLISALEEEFSIEYNEEDIMAMMTVGEIITRTNALMS